MGRADALHSRKSPANKAAWTDTSSQSAIANTLPVDSAIHKEGTDKAARDERLERKQNVESTRLPQHLGPHDQESEAHGQVAPLWKKSQGRRAQPEQREKTPGAGSSPKQSWRIPATAQGTRRAVAVNSEKGGAEKEYTSHVQVGYCHTQGPEDSQNFLDRIGSRGKPATRSHGGATQDAAVLGYSDSPVCGSTNEEVFTGCTLQGFQAKAGDMDLVSPPESPENGKDAPLTKGCTDATQESVFCSSCLPLVDKLLAGYSASVIAYGQTGAGKSYTMVGDRCMEDFHRGLKDAATRGMIPRIIESLLRRTETLSRQNSGTVFSIRGSLIEIYNESVRDLLTPGRNSLQIRESSHPGTVITDAVEVPLSSVADVLDVIQTGFANRALGTTLSNEKSSRSHAIFQITLRQDSIAECTTKSSQLLLVDLAGSERVSKANTTGERLREAQNINRSLLALGNVINALPPTAGSPKHVPYRESKLTRLLQQSLGGNSFTVILLCCSPHSFNIRETLSTLRFGSRAAHVQNKPQSMEALSPGLLQRRLVESQTELRFSQARLRAYVTQNARQLEAIKMLQRHIPEDTRLSPDDTALLQTALDGCSIVNGLLKSPPPATCPTKTVAPSQYTRMTPPLHPRKLPPATRVPPVTSIRDLSSSLAGQNRPQAKVYSAYIDSLPQGRAFGPQTPQSTAAPAPAAAFVQPVSRVPSLASSNGGHLPKVSEGLPPHSAQLHEEELPQDASLDTVPQFPPQQRQADLCAVADVPNLESQTATQEPACRPVEPGNEDKESCPTSAKPLQEKQPSRLSRFFSLSKGRSLKSKEDRRNVQSNQA
ncbi:putative kinesin [Besnoitia besnoiti]|uniref:Kinesin-like protein n=1 Tax=Besnoitia besnoiti TaxID=94643 RepID=A0A2A9MH13_BESBE|nr:putative kinesin [Besnoitia besnoiti]PFH34710.1 putative kinesin [Besnoitia besnoiti]